MPTRKRGDLISHITVWISLSTLFARHAAAESTVSYVVSFEHAVHHEARIAVTFTEVPRGPLEIRMSRSSPGRYALHEFAKNVYGLRATDGSGQRLQVQRPTPHRWDVWGHDGTVKVEYWLFADRADGTYSAIGPEHAHLNMPATFVWARGFERTPIELRFVLSERENWDIVTQLERTSDAGTFRAPDLQYLMDSPTKLAPLSLRSWTVGPAGSTQTIRLAVYHKGEEADVDRFTKMAQAVVREHTAVFGELPRFDHGEYTFIASYVPHVHGDGMEHRNSTILTSRTSLDGRGALRNLGTLSHEFVHAWNVERIRPRSLEPFDFERANPCEELWFAEGFTSYYADLAIRRAGYIDDDDYARRISNPINAVLTSPGRRLRSAVDMSRLAPFVDAARSVDPVNWENTFLSYYTFGNAIGLGLDLTLRRRFPGLSLDDYMRLAWVVHGKREIPYTRDDLRELLATLTRDRDFARDFFARFIEGHEVVDYAALLEAAGLSLVDTTAGKTSLGRVELECGEDGARLGGDPVRGSPCYRAGLARGDRIAKLGGVVLRSDEDLQRLLGEKRPGDRLEAEVHRGERTWTVSIRLGTAPSYRVVPFERDSRPLSPKTERFRKGWLGSRGTAATSAVINPKQPANRRF